MGTWVRAGTTRCEKLDGRSHGQDPFAAYYHTSTDTRIVYLTSGERADSLLSTTTIAPRPTASPATGIQHVPARTVRVATVT